ncbi:MAG: glycosyltransferase family 4 protein [Chloroflexota bacterium]
MIAILSCWPPSVAAGSGTTVSQSRLVDALARAGVEAEVLYTSRFATSPAELEQRRRLNEELGPGLERYEGVLGIDGEGWLLAARQRRTPYVAFCEAVLVEVLPFEEAASAELLRVQAGWEAAAAQSADAVVARSAFAARRVTKAYGVGRDRVTVLPIPVDVEAWRTSLPAATQEPLVLAVGHAYPRKNYRGLLAAWPSVVAAHPGARLTIVGIGPESPLLEQLVADMPSVSLLGHIPYAELLALYARARVFCHPSLQENFGIAVVEGLASGASVVTHQHPALLENTAGLPGTWAVDAADPTALAEALAAALSAPARWPDTRLDDLRRKLSPLAVGEQLRGLLLAIGAS